MAIKDSTNLPLLTCINYKSDYLWLIFFKIISHYNNRKIPSALYDDLLSEHSIRNH